MSYGFQFFNSDSSLSLSSDSIAYIMIDSFTVSRPSASTKSYPGLHSGAVIIASFVPMYDSSFFTTGETGLPNGSFWVSSSGSSITWGWSPGQTGIYPYNTSLVYVYAR